MDPGVPFSKAGPPDRPDGGMMMPGGPLGMMPGAMPGMQGAATTSPGAAAMGMPGMMMPPMMMGAVGGAAGGGPEAAAPTMQMMPMANPMFAATMGGGQAADGAANGAGQPGQAPMGGMVMPGMAMMPMMGGMMANPMMSMMAGANGAATGVEAGKDGDIPAQPPGVPPGMVMVPNPMFEQLKQANPQLAQMMAQMQEQMLKGGGMGMMMNPMMMQQVQQFMASNPMMGGMMRPPQPPGADAPATASVGGGQPQHEAKQDDVIDPEVQELGDYFNIEERWIRRLNETMKKRPDTKEQDIAKLYEVLERARSPTGLLTVKIGEMECGQFVGKIKPDKDVERLAKKFKLDEHVISRLTELAVRRKDTKEADLERMEQHLRYCKRPSAMATLLAGKLLEGEVEELPDLSEAEALMSKYKLDEDAKSKLREIVEKRNNDPAVMQCIKKHLDSSTYPSSMLCKIARPLIDGERIPDPPERKDRPQRENNAARNSHRDEERGGRDDRDRDRGRRSRSRDRDRRDRDRRGRSRS